MNIPKNNRPVALITGAAKRIGKAITIELHSRGVDIAIHCNDSKMDALQLALNLNNTRNNSAYVIQKTLTDPTAAEEIITNTLKKFNRLDYLVNNASIFYPMTINDSDEKQIKEIVMVNATQPKKLMLLAKEEIKKRQGAMVNMIDIYAQRGHQNHTAYVASKSILLELTKQLALEMAPDIRVNSVSPGVILWPYNETNAQEKQRSQILQNTAIKEIGLASDISQTVAFLLLDAHYMTGANINVDGGRNLYI